MISDKMEPHTRKAAGAFLIIVAAGIYFYATQHGTTTPSRSGLNEQAKLGYVAQQGTSKEAGSAAGRTGPNDQDVYCNRFDNESLQNRCHDDLQNRVNTPRTSPEYEGSSTLEPLQNVSINDERRYSRAALYGDVSYCDEITDEDLRLYCYEEVSS